MGAGHGRCLRPLPTETGQRVTRVSFAQISWSPDSTHLLSASGDKTSKVWDVGANSVVNTFTMGSNILDQQLGCLWQNDHLLSISLSGYINYLDKNNPSKPLRVIKVRTCRGRPRLRGGRGRGVPPRSGETLGGGVGSRRPGPGGFERAAGAGCVLGCELSRGGWESKGPRPPSGPHGF